MRRASLAAVLLALIVTASPLAANAAAPARAAAPNPRMQGPKALVLTYHVAPRDRLAFRRAHAASSLALLDRLKAERKLRDYQVLWNRYVDEPSWTMMVFLQFERSEDLFAWRQVEETMLGGLGADALALIKSIETAPADLMREKRVTEPGAPRSVFLVVPYDYLIGTDDYVRYVDGYVLKQADGWIAQKALTGYRFYLGRYAATRPWSSLLLLEYRGDAGLAARDATLAKVRASLANDPEWSAFATNKQNVRVERTPAVADELAGK